MFTNRENIQADLVGKLDDFEHVLHYNSRVFLFARERVCSAIDKVVKAYFEWADLVIERLGHFISDSVLIVCVEKQKHSKVKVLLQSDPFQEKRVAL